MHMGKLPGFPFVLLSEPLQKPQNAPEGLFLYRLTKYTPKTETRPEWRIQAFESGTPFFSVCKMSRKPPRSHARNPLQGHSEPCDLR